ncbi:MAG TPA: hypothetical protein EYP36_02495 [Calditrichaeota bacterium]|nr:hypothetical protein [Calditrichota bacterium]
MSQKIIRFFERLYYQKDKLWLSIWLGGLLLVWGWDRMFLNHPAMQRVETGFLNSFIIAVLVLVFSLLLSWVTVNSLLLPGRWLSGLFVFLLNILRSIPQIVGILFGYVAITVWLQGDVLRSSLSVLVLMAVIISLFVFQEIVDLMLERVEHFRKSDFYQAMLVRGVAESRIINYDILWMNSRIHIFNKLIAIFGTAVFLQCSVDFIISVGLSTTLSSVNLPSTLGTLLANIDSKQDILAIGNTLMNPSYIGKIFFEHLQGVTVAFLIVFSLLSIYKIANGFTERFKL